MSWGRGRDTVGVRGVGPRELRLSPQPFPFPLPRPRSYQKSRQEPQVLMQSSIASKQLVSAGGWGFKAWIPGGGGDGRAGDPGGRGKEVAPHAGRSI